MDRDAGTRQGAFLADDLALGMPGIEGRTGLVAPEALDDLVDDCLRHLGRGDPLGADLDLFPEYRGVSRKPAGPERVTDDSDGTIRPTLSRDYIVGGTKDAALNGADAQHVEI